MPEISLWKASRLWVRRSESGAMKPDIDVLEEAFKDASVDVAYCGETDECGAQRRERMSFSEFATLWRNSPDGKLYLKDFHFCLAGQSGAYRTPDVFADDWLNSYAIAASKGEDDFRFVYLGQHGTNTNFHRDVYGSHSWSCSLAGVKRWRFLAPEYTHLVRDDKSGDMPTGIFSAEAESRFPDIGEARKRIITVWQYPGEAVFVPSGWLHEVQNFGETLSINHNWANATCLLRMSLSLEEEVRLGQQALEGFELGSPQELAVLVQDLTTRNFGWGWKDFFEMIRWRYVGCQEHPPLSTQRKLGVAWDEAADYLRPPPDVERQLVTQVMEEWLRNDENRYLIEVKAVAEEILKHVQH